MEKEIILPGDLDLETAKDILDDQNVDYRIAIIAINQQEDIEEILYSIDSSKVATYVNFWQQVYFDWFDYE